MKQQWIKNAQGDYEHYVDETLRATVHPDNVEEYKEGLNEDLKAGFPA